jgi:hypothetical protein
MKDKTLNLTILTIALAVYLPTSAVAQKFITGAFGSDKTNGSTWAQILSYKEDSWIFRWSFRAALMSLAIIVATLLILFARL